MLLDRLESGYLLFETRQGLVRVELSKKQRIYLLWTFRNFRQLSLPLLSGRQRRLVNDVFLNGAKATKVAGDPSLVIGVVENFVPPMISRAVSFVAVEQQHHEEQTDVLVPAPQVADEPILVPAPSRRIAWSKVAWPRLATTVGALVLCIVSVAAWHRIQGIPTSQAQSEPRLQPISAIVPSNVPSLPESATADSTLSTVSAAQPVVAPKAASETLFKPESAPALISIPVVVASAANSKPPARAHVAATKHELPLSDIGGGIQASRPPLRFTYPDYSDVRARGAVSLTADVDSDGVVRTVKVISGNRALASAAVRAVRQWRYRPYVKDGQPVATETNIVISFIAGDAISMTFPPNIASMP
jgi:TonB family protein